MPDHIIETITRTDRRYPVLLRQIADPPEQLYCRGDVSLLDTFCISVVGSRKASDYGRQVTADIAGNLARNGITIVSGLAMGIDAAAHRASLDVGGKTIAVFGTGVDDDNIYPTENFNLAHEIMNNGGLLISELAPGMHGVKFSFPIRNRIISGLSRGVLVIEADRKSGSLITAKSALDQNRDVFAIPGGIYWPRSVGTNLLIQQGARPVMSSADILEAYVLRQVALPDTVMSTSDPVQECILTLLSEHGPLHVDALTTQSGQEASHVMAALSMLELRDVVAHQGGGVFRLLNRHPK